MTGSRVVEKVNADRVCERETGSRKPSLVEWVLDRQAGVWFIFFNFFLGFLG